MADEKDTKQGDNTPVQDQGTPPPRFVEEPPKGDVHEDRVVDRDDTQSVSGSFALLDEDREPAERRVFQVAQFDDAGSVLGALARPPKRALRAQEVASEVLSRNAIRREADQDEKRAPAKSTRSARSGTRSASAKKTDEKK